MKRQQIDEAILRAKIAREKYGKYASLHEVMGVLQEEFFELTDALHRNDAAAFRYELLDIAAVCLRAATEETIREDCIRIESFDESPYA